MYSLLAPVLQTYLVVSNNRLCLPYFEVQRGVRQYNPLPFYLFIIAGEILAIAIQTNTDIHGLQTGKEEFKVVQYAKDLTVLEQAERENIES